MQISKTSPGHTSMLTPLAALLAGAIVFGSAACVVADDADTETDTASSELSFGDFDLAGQNYFTIRFTAGSNTYDGTNGRVYYRLYDELHGVWSRWYSFAGLARGHSKTVTVYPGQTLRAVSRLRVWLGDDGARISVRVTDSAQGSSGFSPSSRWIKNGGYNFVPVYEFVGCDVQHGGAIMCSCTGKEDCAILMSACGDLDSSCNPDKTSCSCWRD